MFRGVERDPIMIFGLLLDSTFPSGLLFRSLFVIIR